MDRVFVCTTRREMFRRRRVRKSEVEKMMSGDVSAVDELACPSFRVQQTTQDREAPAEFQPKLRSGGAAAGFNDSEEDFMPGDELEPDVEELFRE